jgi:hypothetical protein
MKFEDLEKAHNEYQVRTDFDVPCRESIKKKNIWGDLSELNDEKVKSEIIKFLIDFNCRGVSYKCAPELCKKLKEYDKYIQKFKNNDLLDFDFENNDNLERITEIFNGLSSIIKYTATSKTLHMINPYFFVMWDANIRKKYGCFENGAEYANFLWRIKKELNNVITHYAQEKMIDIETAKCNIEKKCDMLKMSLVKLIDEYNWIEENF